MPSWWPRNSSTTTTASATRRNKGKCKEKQKSFDESIPIFHSKKPQRNSYDFTASSIHSFNGFDSDIANEIVEKKAYPLPRPSMDFHKKLVVFDSQTNASASSSSSSSYFDDDDDSYGIDPVLHDHGDFSSFVEVEETKCYSRSRTSCPASKTSPRQSDLWDAVSVSPPGKQERHPCHRLPLPPDSPIKSSQNLLSNWKKGKLLGRGAFGHVYVGFNSESGQMCAIKEVRLISDDQSSQECLKQLNQEIALLSELSHHNIVQYYGSKLGRDKLSVYLEYVSGGSIHKLLEEYGPFTEPVIRSYTKQILCGLAYLHGRNTVHRDIKGANILVDPNGEIKLGDFGMAKHIASCSSMLSFKGSPYWMAPEIITNTSSYSLAVDIWSLGCTILEMATSKSPWSQYEGVAAIFKIANSKGYPTIPSYLSEDAQSFVKICLQRDPSARPTAAQLLHHPFISHQDTRGNACANSFDDGFSTLRGRHPHKSLFTAQERHQRIKHITKQSRASEVSWDELSLKSMPESL